MEAKGLTYRDLVKLLDDTGIETKEGGIWRPATIRQILIRPVAYFLPARLRGDGGGHLLGVRIPGPQAANVRSPKFRSLFSA